MLTIDVKRLADEQSRSEVDVIDVRMPTAFVGAGLVFAGATGYRPMASTIAGMPWNQCEVGGSCSA